MSARFCCWRRARGESGFFETHSSAHEDRPTGRSSHNVGDVRAVLPLDFLGAPFADRLRGNVALTSALTAVTAAVVGVVLNLAVWFAIHTIFARVTEFRLAPIRVEVPVLRSVSLPPLMFTVAALIAVFRFKAGPLAVIAVAACGASALAGTCLQRLSFANVRFRDLLII